MTKSSKRQNGGLDPLLKLPSFKYTFNEKRKLLIGYIYPYSDYFINCVTSLPFQDYYYNDMCEYINIEDNTQQMVQCSSDNNKPLYWFLGGTAYELLNRKFKNVNMHDYCDATADIDVSLYPPKITYHEDLNVSFFNVDGKITLFYKHFTNWTYQNMVLQIESINNVVNNINNIVSFDINEYQDIPEEHKTPDFGYNNRMIGKLHVVSFLNEDKTMFKTQVVCKIEDSGISVIDHIIEIIIPLPESGQDFVPSDDAYKVSPNDTVTINTNTYNIASYISLIQDNLNAYIARKGAYGASNEMDVIHKPINHIARIFYLFEVMYQNQPLFSINKIAMLFLFGMPAQKRKQVDFLYYYKIVAGKFYTIQVDTKFFLNSYLELLLNALIRLTLLKMFLKLRKYTTYLLLNYLMMIYSTKISY